MGRAVHLLPHLCSNRTDFTMSQAHTPNLVTSSAMPPHGRRSIFPFLDLPAGELKEKSQISPELTIAEMRNNIYDNFLGIQDRVRRLKLPSKSTKSAQTSFKLWLSLAHFNQQLRAESFSYYFEMLNVGVRWRVLERFLGDFCCTVTENGVARTRCPKAMTVYLDGFPNMDDKSEYCQVVDLLPLLELRLRCPQPTCTFEPDPKINWQLLHCVQHVSGRLEFAIDRIVSAGTDFAKLIYYDNEKWMALVREKKITRILVHAWKSWVQAKVRLVFKDQPYAQLIDAKVVPILLPDPAALGY